jgi:KAP family P-loop domain
VNIRWKQFSRFLAVVILGTGAAFLLLLLIPLIKPNGEILKTYGKQSLPIHSIVMAIVVGVAFVVILLGSLGKAWRSLRLGLVPFSSTIWFVCILIFWLSVELHVLWLAIAAIASPGAVALLIKGLRKHPKQNQSKGQEDFETDLPVPENGRDLLGRGETVETVVAKILLERPSIMAIIAPYGDGKTSFLNLLLGKLRKSEETDRPIIVKYNPWLAADPNNLVLSLFNSIVVEMRKTYFIPGLKRDALEYARTLLSAIPQLDRLKTFLQEPSQEEQIEKLAKRISATDRHILVVMDDLDRLQSSELETVFKVLRGSDAFVNLTFVCCFDRGELVQILRATRPHQDTDAFIEKFFQSIIPLPAIDSANLRDLFSQKIDMIVHRHNLSGFDQQKTTAEFWDKGASNYFQNLRRIKLFLSRIDHSLARIGAEVNFQDFIRLELVRDIA